LASPSKIRTICEQEEGDVGRSDSRKIANLRTGGAIAAVAAVLWLTGCGIVQTYQHGYIIPEHALEQIPLGASQDQVLIVLGTPSTVATISGEVFYYISQRSEQTSFLPQEEVDRRVVAVYFDKGRRVQRLANYGVKDGKVFDFVSRTTPSGGQELNYLTYVFKVINPLGK